MSVKSLLVKWTGKHFIFGSKLRKVSFWFCKYSSKKIIRKFRSVLVSTCIHITNLFLHEVPVVFHYFWVLNILLGFFFSLQKLFLELRKGILCFLKLYSYELTKFSYLEILLTVPSANICANSQWKCTSIFVLRKHHFRMIMWMAFLQKSYPTIANTVMPNTFITTSLERISVKKKTQKPKPKTLNKLGVYLHTGAHA